MVRSCGQPVGDDIRPLGPVNIRPNIGFGRTHRHAANRIQTAIAIPIPTLAAVATTRPRKAPVATRVAARVSVPRDHSATRAPRNDPTNAPMTDPITGTGTPTIAPTTPPRIAPHPARR